MATLIGTAETMASIIGVSAGEVTVTAELLYIAEQNEGPISFVPAIKDTFTLTVEALELFDVTFDLNGGNIDEDEADVVATDVVEGTLVGQAQPLFTPVRTGYTWTSPYWVTTAEGDTDGASEPVVADVTVYAYWVQD